MIKHTRKPYTSWKPRWLWLFLSAITSATLLWRKYDGLEHIVESSNSDQEHTTCNVPI